MSVFGHQQLQQFFATALQEGRLGQAYCLVGEEHIGKKYLAETIAKQLLQTDVLKTHPDYVFIEREINPKTGTLKKHIDVSQIARVRAFFSRFAAVENGYRVVIIDNAHEMNEQATNALLKTLEELPPRSLLFFITSQEDRIAKTIYSRLARCYATALSVAEMTAFSQTLGGSVSPDMIRDARGKPGLLYRFVTEHGCYEEYQQDRERFIALWGKPFHEKTAQVDALFSSKDDHMLARARVLRLLDTWMVLLRDYYIGNDDAMRQELPAMTTLSQTNMVLLLQQIARAKQLIAQQVHPRLVVEHILLSIP